MKCNFTRLVWSSAIFDHQYAMDTTGDFRTRYLTDFNVAIERMEGEPMIIGLNQKIDSMSTVVAKQMEGISDKSDDSYDKLMSLYSNVIELSNQAKKPSGNLQSFSNNVNEKAAQINMLITELKARNPEIE